MRSAGFRAKHGFEQLCGAQVFLRRQPRNFGYVTLVAHQKENFRGFVAIFLVAQLPPKEVFQYTINSGGAKKRRANEKEKKSV